MSNGLTLGIVLLMLVAVALLAADHFERTERRKTAAAALAKQRHPSRKRPVPGLPVDGEPLPDEDWDAFIGCIWASNQTIDEPRYGDHHA
jgi:hypothetical protein